MRARLRHRSDRRTLAFLASYAAAVTLGFGLFDHLPWWGVGLAAAGLGWLGFCTGTIVHNTVHVPIMRTARDNRVLQIALSVLYGASVSGFVRGHNYSHHRHLQGDRDLMRTTKARFRWNLLNQLALSFLVTPAVERGNRRYIARERAADSAWYRQYRLEKHSIRASLLAAFLLDWRAALAFCIVPRVIGIWGIVAINYVQHDGCDPAHPVNHSRNIVGRWVNWWTFNNGFHAAHHHDPSVHWSRVPELHARTIAPLNHPNLNRQSLAHYLFETCIWPGRRVDLAGHPYAPPPAQPDRDWVPPSHRLAEDGISLGAVEPTPPGASRLRPPPLRRARVDR